VNVGEQVRALRQQRGLTLAALAGEELSVALVSKIERGLVSPSLNSLVYLASRLGVSPARLLESDGAQRTAAGAVAAARAYLLLGDPANAARHAAGALGTNLPPAAQARLLAVQAEAQLAAGRTGEAAAGVLQGSGLVAPGDAGEHRRAAAELAWTLGLLERRRGDRMAAQRSWVRCLELLAAAPDAEVSLQLLAARAQIELAALHEVDGALETARHFLSRAATTLAHLADPSSVAQGVLAAVPDAPSADGLQPPAPLAGALALAVTAAASRLIVQVGRDLARLERAAARWPAAVAPAEVSHSRHLR
jgi:transcriptional regulator with XRE-family HTH domain